LPRVFFVIADGLGADEMETRLPFRIFPSQPQLERKKLVKRVGFCFGVFLRGANSFNAYILSALL
jgi:hypothetical protein